MHLMRTFTTMLAVLIFAGAAPQAQQPAQAPPPSTPAAPAEPAPATPAAGTSARTFAAPAGIIFNAVRPDRTADFEIVMGYLRAALEKSTDPAVQAQARGWRVFKASEPGPNATVLYVFLLDPAAPGADYGLGRILSDAYPDQVQDIWKLYTGALAGGGSLLNLTPVQAAPPPAAAR
jgi:pyruvate/2-oxoglutarate dehydrogenase complex dihydrolipoamide acyltransferase (E2) component